MMAPVVDAMTNWAGNVTFGARRVCRPYSLEDLRRTVVASERTRVLGTGHSFNRIADTDGDLISVADLPPIMDLDEAASTVTVGAGVRYGELAAYLHERGYALHNLGSLPHISVVGAVATATHGSGVGNGNLATAVRALQMITADGVDVALDRNANPAEFPGAVVALGALGVVTHVTLDVRPSFELRQYVYDGLPIEVLDGPRLREILADGYSVSLFTDWTGPRINQVWAKRPADAPPPPPVWFGATLADSPRHPIAGMSTVNCTEQLGVPGPWHERLPHFRLEFTPSSGEELQSEYFVPSDRAAEALTAVDRIRDVVAPVLQISEVRAIAGDDLWLSPCYGRDSVAIHFTWVKDTDRVLAVLAELEDVLAPFDVRPHWGKLFRTAPEAVRASYERHQDFVALMRRYDPAGKFRNDLVDRYFPA